MDEINVVLISSVRPENSFAAAVLMHRHLVNRSGIRLHILPAEYHEIVPAVSTPRLFPANANASTTVGRRRRLPDAHHVTVREAPCCSAPWHAHSCAYTGIPQRLLGGPALREATSIAIDRAI